MTDFFEKKINDYTKIYIHKEWLLDNLEREKVYDIYDGTIITRLSPYFDGFKFEIIVNTIPVADGTITINRLELFTINNKPSCKQLNEWMKSLYKLHENKKEIAEFFNHKTGV